VRCGPAVEQQQAIELAYLVDFALSGKLQNTLAIRSTVKHGFAEG